MVKVVLVLVLVVVGELLLLSSLLLAPTGTRSVELVNALSVLSVVS